MIKTLIAVGVAGAFALPVAAAASAGGDNIVIAQSGGGALPSDSVAETREQQARLATEHGIARHGVER